MTDTGNNIKKNSFKDYYSNPEWKEKHLSYMKEKVVCDCGKSVCRANMSTHKKSHIHIKKMDEINGDPVYRETLKMLADTYKEAIESVHRNQKKEYKN